MLRAGLTLIATTIVVAAWMPATASAATCSDYSNQAQAQRAKDTRDADHDGIYCESLPCPCLKPGRPSAGGAPKPKSKRKATRPKVGRPVALHKRTRGSGCQLRGPLPDPRCTPGSVFSKATPTVFCKGGYTELVRHVTDATKRKVYAEYGITSHRSGQYEVDHLVPLELGGSNSVANLFPEAAKPRPGFHDKDRLEDEVHDRACAGRNSFRSMQQRIASDWSALYVALIGPLPGT